MLRYTRTVDPTREPIALDEAKAQARITDTHSDALLASYITAARDKAEEILGYGLYTQTWRADFEEWDEAFPLPMCRTLQSVTSVKYYDVNGTLQTLSATYYETDTLARPVRLVRASAMSWPTLQADRRIGRIQITYVVGWSAVTSIPEQIKQGLRLWVTYLDADRDGRDPQALAAQTAALACWTDRLYGMDPCA